MTPNSNKSSSEEIIQSWKDYEGDVASARKPYEDVVKKEQKLGELGPASKALLQHVNASFGIITLGDSIEWARKKTKLVHDKQWWYQRLIALALEGRIDYRVYRTGDKVTFTFRKKREESVE